MRFFLAGLLALFSFLPIWSQQYHVEIPGTLPKLAEESGGNFKSIRVTGKLNNKDIAYLRSLSAKPEDLLREIDIEDAILENDSLPYRAFNRCFITKYKLPKTLLKIGKEAFRRNFLLEELIIPEGVVFIDSLAISWNDCLKRVRLPQSLTTLSYSLFSNCVNLQDVALSTNLKSIEEGCFHLCMSLPSDFFSFPKTLESIGDGAFYNCPGLIKFTVTSRIKSIKGAFNLAQELREVDIKTQQLEEIGDRTFMYCGNLERVNIPDKITRIGKYAFLWNLSLKDISIPETVTHIDEGAFDSDPLDSVYIPKNVVFIGTNSFWNNRNLKKVYSAPRIPPSTNRPTLMSPYLPFHSCNEKMVTLYVPKGSAAAYKASEIFANFGTIIELEPWEFPQAIGEVLPTSTASYKVYGASGVLHIERLAASVVQDMQLFVFDLGGRCVLNERLQDRMQIPLSKGVYLVKIGNDTYKVQV